MEFWPVYTDNTAYVIGQKHLFALFQNTDKKTTKNTRLSAYFIAHILLINVCRFQLQYIF